MATERWSVEVKRVVTYTATVSVDCSDPNAARSIAKEEARNSSFPWEQASDVVETVDLVIFADEQPKRKRRR